MTDHERKGDAPISRRRLLGAFGMAGAAIAAEGLMSASHVGYAKEKEVKAASMPDLFINVQDHGAVGDGVADDTVAIQNVLNASAGLTVIIPNGNYKIGSLTIPAQVELIVQNGAVLRPQAPCTIACYGSFIAGPYRVFDFPYIRNSGTLQVQFQGFRSLEYWLPEWFGAVGDANVDETNASLPVVTGTDSSLAFEECLLAMSQTGVSTMKLNHRNFLFEHEVNVFDGNFRLEGSTHAKFAAVVIGDNPSGYKIHIDTGYLTGKGIESLFVIKHTQPFVGYFGFHIGNCFFRSYLNGPVAAVKVTEPQSPTLGAPPRPCVIDNCRFFKFKKAIWANGLFGIGTLNITNSYFASSEFWGEYYSVYSDAYAGVTNFNFINNVSEQGGRIKFDLVQDPTYGYMGSLEGQFRIEGNLLEGQPNPIVIYSNVASGTIRSNYFEANRDSIIEFHSLGRDQDADGLKEIVSTIDISDNFYHVLTNAQIVLNNCIVTRYDIANTAEIKTCVSGVQRFTVDSGNAKAKIFQALGDFCGFSVDFGFLRDNLESAVPVTAQGKIDFNQYGVDLATPLGPRKYSEFMTESPAKAIPIAIQSDEIFIVGAIMKKTMNAANFVGIKIADGSGTVLKTIPPMIKLNDSLNAFTAVFFAVDGTSIAGTGRKLSFFCSQAGNTVTDAYCYTVKKNAAGEQFGIFIK